MQIWRHGETSSESILTDEKSLSDLADDWRNSDGITADATIDKNGSRHTQIAVVLSEEDVIELSSRLFAQLKKENSELRATVGFLQESLQNIWLMTSPGTLPDPPSERELLYQICDIAKFSCDPSCQKANTFPEDRKPDWFDWKSVS